MPLLTCSLVSHDSAILPSNQLKEAIVDGKHLTCRDPASEAGEFENLSIGNPPDETLS